MAKGVIMVPTEHPVIEGNTVSKAAISSGAIIG